MIALFDIGNTHTHIGLATSERIVRSADVPTAEWSGKTWPRVAKSFFKSSQWTGAALCSVAPAATPRVKSFAEDYLGVECFILTNRSVSGVGVAYPKPSSIGPDRLANAVAVKQLYGAPALVVDFGTAVTFDVVDSRGSYVGGVIAPGLNVMTDYLYEKTALLPRIKIRDVSGSIGKSTEQAMLIGAVHGYRGLVRELIAQIRADLKARRLPVIATGGYAKLIANGLPEITAVAPALTLDGLRMEWNAHQRPGGVGSATIRN